MEQKHTHRDRKQAYGYQRGEGVGRKVNKEYGINRQKLLYTKYISNKDLLFSTGNSGQCLKVISYNEK